jgi:hypothetical protein
MPRPTDYLPSQHCGARSSTRARVLRNNVRHRIFLAPPALSFRFFSVILCTLHLHSCPMLLAVFCLLPCSVWSPVRLATNCGILIQRLRPVRKCCGRLCSLRSHSLTVCMSSPLCGSHRVLHFCLKMGKDQGSKRS